MELSRWRVCGRIVVLAACLLSGTARAEEGADLGAEARDPTASVTMLQFRVDHVASFHNLEDADQTTFILQPVIPFAWGEQRHIARITLPYVVEGPDWGLLAEEQADAATGNATPPNYVPTEDKTGLGDTALFDFMVYDAPWEGRYFVGLSATLPTATDPALGSEKWSLGPAAGAIVKSGELMLGGIALSNFSVAGDSDRDDISTLTFQPFGSYGLGDGWSVELSEIAYNYDLKAGKWTSIPLGGRVAKMTKAGKVPLRLFVDAEYNFADSVVAPEWTFRFAVVPLL
jgi:hypothetical protein